VNVIDVMSRLRQARVELWVDGDRLRFSAPKGALGPELRELVAAHRAELMSFLTRAAASAAAGPAASTARPAGGASDTGDPAMPAAPPAITAGVHDGPVPLSFPQRRIWFFEQVRPGTATYHVTASWRVRGALDLAALRRALDQMTSRHDVLRNRFALQGDEPVQVTAEQARVPLAVIDLAGLDAGRRPAERERLLRDEAVLTFDLASAPLLRVTLIREAAAEHVLVVTIHHIIADMWSLGVLVRELSALYRPSLSESPGDLPELRVQYADFATWQRSRLAGDTLARERDYWVRQLGGAPPFLDLPTDRPHPPASTFAAGQELLALTAGLAARINQLSREHQVTRFMTLLAAYAIVLSRYSGETDLVIGSPVAGREQADVEPLIGCFINMLVLRVGLAGDPSFSEVLARVREATLGAFEHQGMPVEHLVEALHPRRDPGRSPLFQVMLSLQNTPMSALRLPGLVLEPLPSTRPGTEYDLTLEFTGTDGELSAALLYNADVFDGATAARMLGHVRTVLEEAVENPGRPASALSLVTSAERHRILADWNATSRALPARRLHDTILSQARRRPEKTALISGDRQLSYAGLEAAVTRLATRLRRAGAAPGTLVAVSVGRSPEMIVAMLAVLRTGAAYLPLDTTLPAERVDYMLTDAAIGLLVTTTALQPHFAGRPVRLVLVDADDLSGSEPGTGLPAEGEPPDGSLAYVIYTSGSTGRPKGVMVDHAGLANFTLAMDEVLGQPGPDAPGVVWLALTSVSFDIAVLELLWPLSKGGTVVIQDDRALLPGRASRVPRIRPLEFSLFYFAVSQDSDSADRYRLLLDGARFADAHGFSAVWTPERHFNAFGGLYPNPSVTAAAVAAVTERVQVRAGSVVLPLHNPIRVAEEWSVVDNLSHGRAGVSFASGWHADDFCLAPEPRVYERRREAMIEQIEVVRRLWRGERVTTVNGAGRELEVATFPRPVRPELPVWLAAAGSPGTFQAAGRIGAGLLTHLLGQTVDDLAGKIDLYRQAWRDAGHPGDGHVALMVHAYVGPPGADTAEVVREPFRGYLRRSFDLVRALSPTLGVDDAKPTEEDMEALLDHAFDYYYHGSALIGSLDECSAMVERLREMGIDEVACLIDFGVDTDAVLESLPLLDQVRQRAAAVARPPAPGGPGLDVASQIRAHGVTHLQCTPSLAGILADDPRTAAQLDRVGYLLLGGEALPPDLAAALAAVPGRQVINMYGPTETTIWSTSWPVADLAGGVSIGRPVANTQVYVLDASLNLAPVGVPGELCIGGQGVTRGYLGRPGLTADRFVPSPFTRGERLYRTGDRARYRPDGRIEFLGRADRQVKLGGHRIELGEIENTLRGHPAIGSAAVVLRPDEAGSTYLVAYLAGPGPGTVAGTGAAPARPGPAELRQYLLRWLPEVMVPAAIVWLDELPLTVSGKVDYRSLPDPATVAPERSLRDSVTARPITPPRDELERRVTEVWQNVLRVTGIGVHDNFFDLGGHSLMAIAMVSRLRVALGREVSLRVVFESATVAELAERLRDAGGEAPVPAFPPLLPAPRDQDIPLSYAQQRIWFFEQMNPGVTAYNLSAAFRLSGALRPRLLHCAFREVVGRHEVLRTRFDAAEGVPRQLIAPTGSVALPLVDLAGLGPAEREGAIWRFAGDDAHQAFDLEHDTLLRTTLLRIAPGEHVLVMTTHHIVSDSWSLGVMAAEVGALYDAYVGGQPSPLPDLPAQYADFTVWQRDWLQGPLVERQLEYWRAALDGAPPVLPLPYDFPPPATRTHRGAQVGFELDRDATSRLKARAQELDTTVFVLLLSVFMTLLNRWAGQEDIVVGVPVAGRDLPELEPLIGAFASITVLRGDLSGDPAFDDLLRRVRQRVLDAYDHQDVPVDKIVADLGVPRDPRHNPLFQVMFVYTNDLALTPAFGSVVVTPLDAQVESVFMDLNMALADTPSGLTGTIDFDTDLFTGQTAEWLLASYQALLAAVVASPDARLSDLPLAPAPASAPAASPGASDTRNAGNGADAGASPAARDDTGAAGQGAAHVVIAATFTASPVLNPVRFWLDELDLPATVVLAPYDQVFQELLSPGSAMAANQHGVNVVLLRLADWCGPDGYDEQLSEDFAGAVRAFQADRAASLAVLLCPEPDPGTGALARLGSRARLAGLLAGIDRVCCVDVGQLAPRYGTRDWNDPVSDEAGRVPYTPAFFAVLGTCLARQLSALLCAYPRVVVIDAAPPGPGLPDGSRRILARVASALAQQGRDVIVAGDLPGLPGGTGAGGTGPGGSVHAWPGDPGPLDLLQGAAMLAGAALGECLFLSADEAACEAVRAGRDVPVLAYPAAEAELADFFAHAWLLDPPGSATLGTDWWEEEVTWTPR
jgi:natural product biosynthesis luciferase-like monooxygenase protein